MAGAALGLSVWQATRGRAIERQRQVEGLMINALLAQLNHELITKTPYDAAQRRTAVQQRMIQACHLTGAARPAPEEIARVLPWAC